MANHLEKINICPNLTHSYIPYRLTFYLKIFYDIKKNVLDVKCNESEICLPGATAPIHFYRNKFLNEKKNRLTVFYIKKKP